MEMLDVLKKLKEIADTNPEIVADALDNVQRTNPEEIQTDEGRVKDAVIGAEEMIGDYVNDDGDLKMPKDKVIYDLKAKSKMEKDAMKNYSINIAMDKVEKEFDDQGQKIDMDMDMDMNSEQPTDEGNAFAQAVQQAKASGLKKGDKFKVGDEEHTLRDSDFEQVNTSTMENKVKKEEKKEIKEAIQMTADTPEEAGVLMQILKLAGVKPVTPDMMGQEPEQEPEQDQEPMQKPEMGMDAMRDVVAKSLADEPADENYANEPNEKVDDVDTLVNVHSGGLNRKKQSFSRAEPGDNPLAVKEVTEEDLSNSLRNQYESFKTAYTEAAKPDFLDLDKDGDKKEPMSKAADEKGDDKKDDSKGLTAAQKKLPAGLQKAIAKKNS